MAPSSNLLLHLRHADPDRYFCTLFAAPEKREGLALLYLFNHELARAREVTSEPLLALIRLTWWREICEGEQKFHEIATPLRAALDAGWFDSDDLVALTQARQIETEAEIPDLDSFLRYVRGTAGHLARIAGKYLGADSHEVEDLGTAYGISGVLRAAPFLARQGRSLLPADGTPQDRLIAVAYKLLAAKPPRAALCAALPAAYVKRDLGRPPAARGLGDRLSVLRAAITGRF